jgi:hypothetical protein
MEKMRTITQMGSAARRVTTLPIEAFAEERDSR